MSLVAGVEPGVSLPIAPCIASTSTFHGGRAFRGRRIMSMIVAGGDGIEALLDHFFTVVGLQLKFLISCHLDLRRDLNN